MTVSGSDTFTRANGALGTADVGGAWSVLVGSVTISSNRAVTSAARSIAVLDAGAGGYDATLDVDCGSGNLKGGYALYFRVTDVNNWWRLSVNAGSSTSSYWDGYYNWEQWHHYAGGSPADTDTGHSFHTTTDLGSQHDSDGAGGYYYYVGGPEYVSSTTFTWTLQLEKYVAGVLTTVATQAVIAAPTHLRVVAIGNSITGWCSTTADATVRQQLAVTDSSNLTATKHGIGYAETSANSNTDGLDNYVASNANTAPTAPPLTYPTGSVSIDRALPLRFSWTFADPDSGDSQSAFDLQYRIGTAAWTTVNGSGGNAFYDMAGGTLSAANYEWQVRTYDRQGLVSPWSASGFFTAATVPSGPTITAPVSGGTIGQNTATVTWTTSTQQSYEVRRVADAAGSPDTGTVYYDSAEIVSTTDRSLVVAFPVNSRAEHVQVRVKNTGLWSSWADARVTISYTPPPTPSTSLSTRPAAGAIDVTLIDPLPGGGVPSIVSNDIYVRTAATSLLTDLARPYSTTGVRVATGVLPSTIWTDYMPAAGVVYEYMIVAYGSNTTTSSSAWNATAIVPGVYQDLYQGIY